LKNKEDLQAAADLFNKKFPVGTEVALQLDSGKYMITKVTHPAQIICESVSAWFEGIRGFYLAERVKEIEK